MLYFSSLRQAPGFVPGLPRVTLIELRQAPGFVPGLLHVCRSLYLGGGQSTRVPARTLANPIARRPNTSESDGETPEHERIP